MTPTAKGHSSRAKIGHYYAADKTTAKRRARSVSQNKSKSKHAARYIQ